MKLLKSQGFTLVELMIAIAVGGVVLTAIVVFFARSLNVYTRENVRAELQQEMRAALEVMARDIRMAGYDPMRSGDFFVKNASATRLQFLIDWDEDGVLDPAPAYPDCENISYRYSAADQSVQLICGEGTGAADTETLIGDTNIQVTSLEFDYRDISNLSTTFLNDIRAAVITLSAQIPAGRAGMQSRTYTTWVDLRNTGPNSNR
ncbi:MAG: prepilin-type N-terminal cleavage/methylation domain-containing protein [Desulfobulbaceae bacterium]|nr:prepilin-type N-terminal cleavage/methylation domain-containing protein [Desulfobulbaceae bacterium]